VYQAGIIPYHIPRSRPISNDAARFNRFQYFLSKSKPISLARICIVKYFRVSDAVFCNSIDTSYLFPCVNSRGYSCKCKNLINTISPTITILVIAYQRKRFPRDPSIRLSSAKASDR